MKRRTLVLFLGVILIGCGRHESISQHESDLKDSLIVFYNVKETSRKEIAENLQKVSSMGPKLIALEILFPELKDKEGDSILSSVLGTIDNLIMAADIAGDSVIERTNDYFKTDSTVEGLLSYLVNENGTTTQYVANYMDDSGQLFAFPDYMVYLYQPETLYRLQNLFPHDIRPIHYTKTFENFHMIDKDNLQPELIEDKIVIFGIFDTGDDYYIIPFRRRRLNTFTSVITANIILDILAEHKRRGPNRAEDLEAP